MTPQPGEALREASIREALDEAAAAAALAFTDHGLPSEPFHAIVMPLRRAVSYLGAAPVAGEGLREAARRLADEAARIRPVLTSKNKAAILGQLDEIDDRIEAVRLAANQPVAEERT